MTDKKKAISDALAGIEKRFGAGAIMRPGTFKVEKVEVISTGCLSLNAAIGIGGFPRGRITEVAGPESCLDADTFIRYESRTANGRRQDHKGGTIATLFHRFHKIPRPGKRHTQDKRTINSIFTAPCMNEEGRIFHNKIVDVFDTGQKPCFEVTTALGEKITTTADHKFYTGRGYSRLKSLSIGDVVYIHNSTPFTKEYEPKPWRKEVYVKHHPTENTKLVEGKYLYHRMDISRATVEAHMNGLAYDVYIARLNEGDLNGLVFLDANDHVHHQDEDHTNNAIENLEVLSPSEHGRIHALERYNNLRFTVVSDMITEIKPVGIRQTYDVRMETPFNNYVANKFVVHNSGKTTAALHAVAEAQKIGVAAYIDIEHAIDPAYAMKLGVNIDDWLISQPSDAEEALEIAQALIESKSIEIVVIDSVAAMVPRAELAGEMGDSLPGLKARLMGQALRKLVPVIGQSNTCVIFINQIRNSIGVTYGSNEFQPGGKALKYAASVRLDIRRIGQVKDGEEVIGNRTRVKVVKNKMARPFRECEFDVIYGEGISKEGDLVDLAVTHGIIQRSGAWFSCDGHKLGQGREKAKDALKKNNDLRQTITDAVNSKLGF